MLIRQRKIKIIKFTWSIIALLLLLFVIGIWLIPVGWIAVTSFKPRTSIFTIPPTLVFKPTLEHYVRALRFLGIVAGIRNSLVIALTTTFITLLVAVPAGYAYARFRFKFREQLSFFTLFTQMAPPISLLIPFFVILHKLKMFDTYIGMITIHLTLLIPFSIWLMITYFQDLPLELEEAALIDGASLFTTFIYIMLPQVVGGIAVAGILAFITSWNEFLYASILTGSRTQTVQVAIFSFLTTEETLWGPFAATGTMIMIPVVVVVLIAQKHIIKGLTFGAIK